MVRISKTLGILCLLLLSRVAPGAEPVTSPSELLPAQPPAVVAEVGLLWRVVAASGAVSHLFGTMHSSDPKVTILPQAVITAFNSAQRVVLELDMDPKTAMESARLMMREPGSSLSDDIPAELLERVHELAAEKGWSAQVLERLKPWAVAVTLGMPPRKPGEALDLKLATLAREQGKPVSGLESVEEQLQTFNTLSTDEQIALLRDVVDQSQDLPAFYAELQRAYLARDLSRILELGRKDLDKPDAALAKRLLDALLDGRNRLMDERMQGYLQQGDSFIAVGALHLPGEAGLLSLLKRRGYRVTVAY